MGTTVRQPPTSATSRASRDLRASAKRAGWRALYGRWPRPRGAVDGYTAIMPLPGDLPVFLELALAGFAHQDPEGHVETLVVPDRITPAFAATFERVVRRGGWGPARMVRIAALGRALQRLTGEPYLNHFLQVYHGVAAARSTHLLLHDADLFLNDAGFLAKRYRRCRERELACLGVEPVFDEWYEQNGHGPVVVTWELMFEARWIRAFPPWQVHGHYNTADGVEHEFDTTDYLQVMTPRDRRELWEQPESFVHFRWAITIYRFFQRAAGQPFEDDRFLLLLIRLLTDAFERDDGDDSHPELPSAAQLARGITDAEAPVTYVGPGRPERYRAFREMIGRVMDGPVVEDARAEMMESALRPFDVAFG